MLYQSRCNLLLHRRGILHYSTGDSLAVTVPLFGGSFNPVQLAAVRDWADALAAAAKDDPQAALLARHKGIIIALVRRYIASAEARGLTVDDLLQLGALEILDAWPEYDATKGKESTFLLPRLYNRMQRTVGERLLTQQPHMVDIAAPLSHDNDLTLGDVLPADADVEDDVIKRDDKDRQRAALKGMWSSLTPFEQALIEMFYVQQMDGEAIAHLLGITRETVRSHLAHTLGRLRAAHELAQSLRKSDTLTGRLSDPKDPHQAARKRAARLAKQSQPTV